MTNAASQPTPTDWNHREQEFLAALRVAEQANDPEALEGEGNGPALFYTFREQFQTAAPYWRRGAELTARSTAPDAREFATYLHNMAERCLIPAGLREEARTLLRRVREIYGLHFRSEVRVVRESGGLDFAMR